MSNRIDLPVSVNGHANEADATPARLNLHTLNGKLEKLAAEVAAQQTVPPAAAAV
jgi:hypothetical protein